MASSPRLRGADALLYMKTESTFGTAPSGDWIQRPFISMGIGSTAEIEDDNVLSASAEPSRDANGLGIGRATVAGDVIVPVDLENFGAWLRLLFGAPTTSGSSDYVHTFISGAESLPSASIEKVMTRIDQFGLLTGIKANTMTIAAGTEERPRATIGLMGKAEAFSGSSGAGTPTWGGMTRFHQRQLSITDDGSAFPNINSFSLTYSNGLEPYYDLNSAGVVSAIDEGRASCSGSFTGRISEDTLGLIADGRAETAHALVLKWQISSTALLEFTIHEALLSAPTIGITGPAGTDVTFNWNARYNTAGGEMLQVILKNQTATYA